MCVPFTGSEAWTRSMGYKIVDEWRAWTSNGQIAGYFHYLFLFSFFFSRSRFLEFNTKSLFDIYKNVFYYICYEWMIFFLLPHI